jgi:proteasome lid subunit RPN8/RPN11
MRVTIKKDVFYEMLFHCLRESPVEAYGYLAGSGEVIEVIHKMPSLKDESALPDPSEGFRLRREMKERGHKLLGVFRAHARTDRPTRMDVDSSSDPDVVQFIVALSEEGMPTVKAYAVRAGNSTQITVDIE